MPPPVQEKAAWCAALSVALLLVSSSAGGAGSRYSFTTLEGEVVAVSEHEVEGALALLALDVIPDGGSADEVRVLLGPPAACEEIGFEVETGDRVRIRVLVASEGEPVKAQRALNISRGLMVRFRTMHDTPLWNAAGAWQGGPGRAWQGGGRGRGPGEPPRNQGRGPDRPR